MIRLENTSWTFRENALDLIRLFAAAQVMVLHSFEFTVYTLTDNLFFDLLRLFPGVPVFFFISGYLISKSYEHSPNLLSYIRNRVLRIFPALIICVFLNLIMIAMTGYFSIVEASFLDLLQLFLAKITVLQFYNPDFMRGFGDGVLNGSLWTICVELQFYFIVPILYEIFRLKRRRANRELLLSILVFVVANRLLYLSEDGFSETVVWKLYRVSFIPWIYMFLFGLFVQRNFSVLAAALESIKFRYLFVPIILIFIVLQHLGLEFGNNIPPFVFFPIALTVFSFAYSFPEFSTRMLKGNDVSYGVYIWHMPIVNQLLYLKDNIQVFDVILVNLISVVLAILSWFLLEKRMLGLKQITLKSQPLQRK